MKSMKTASRTATWIAAAAFIAMASGCGDSDGNSEKSLTIKRDAYGVPHIYADTTEGLFYGYGYAVAEDRLFQMEIAKRSVLGTGAEVLGPAYAARDIGARELFDPVSIKAQLAALSKEDRDIFEGYANGFNARIQEVLADKQRLLPKQFTDAGFEPVPWTGYDVAMIWVGTMANRYSNSSSEISNLSFLDELKAAKGDSLGQQLFEQLRWLEDTTAPTTVPRAGGYTPVQVATGKQSQNAKRLAALHRPAVGPRREGIAGVAAAHPSTARGAAQVARLAPVSGAVFTGASGLTAAWRGTAQPEERPVASNLWIVGGSKTSDGSTILNNGPQFGWVNPSYVYGIGLHGAGYDVTGNTPFAHPIVLFGTNGHISWGATAGPLDVNDIYQERLNPANQNEYMFNGAYQAMKKRTEIIKVKGEADRSVDVLSTVHGLVTAVDAANNTAYSKKRSWDGYEIESLLGWITSMKAKNWDEWLAQASRVAITINWYYADAKGNIGYVSPGRLPMRPASQDIRLPALGDGSMEWEGIRPFSAVPKVYNPPQGYIVNWNNQPAPGEQTDGGNYSIVDRVNEFIFRIEDKPKLSPDEVWDLNRLTSFADTNARYFVPYIVAATSALPPSDPVYQAAQLLANWNGLNTNPTDSQVYSEVGATVMRTWLPIMLTKLLADDLPASILPQFTSGGYPSAPPAGSIRPGTGSKILYNALLGSKAGVKQTYDFFNGADKNAMIRDALAEAVTNLTTQFGSDSSKWLTPVVAHRFSPNNFLGYPQAGSGEVLELPTFMNRGTENHKVSFSAGGAVSMCTAAPPGQSGFVALDGSKSKHYDDQLDLYKSFGCKSESLTQKEVDANLESTKKLSY